MPKYRAAMTAFGLERGQTFESNDPRWEDHVKAGNVTRVDDSDKLTVPEDAIVVPDSLLAERVAAGDKEPVKEGEFYRERVEGGDDGEQGRDDG